MGNISESNRTDFHRMVKTTYEKTATCLPSLKERVGKEKCGMEFSEMPKKVRGSNTIES